MEILKDFGMLIYNVLKGIINTGSSLLILYLVIYVVVRCILLGNSKSDFKQFRKSFNTGCINYARAFAEISKAHFDSAKLWAEMHIARNSARRKENNIR